MFVVLILFEGQGNAQFLFEKYDNANRAYKALLAAKHASEENVAVIDDEWIDGIHAKFVDDYGSDCFVSGQSIRAVLLQDVARALEGATALQLIQQQANASFQKKAAADPRLRILSTNSQMLPGMMPS